MTKGQKVKSIIAYVLIFLELVSFILFLILADGAHQIRYEDVDNVGQGIGVALGIVLLVIFMVIDGIAELALAISSSVLLSISIKGVENKVFKIINIILLVTSILLFVGSIVAFIIGVYA